MSPRAKQPDGDEPLVEGLAAEHAAGATDPQARAKELGELIRYHRRRYFQQDAPEIADAEYDALVVELRNLEDEHPELAKGSPLDELGAPPSTQFAPVRHAVRMMSLDNAFSLEELEAWGEPCRAADHGGGRVGRDAHHRVRLRAEDRRAGSFFALRVGPLRPGGDAR